MSTIDHLSHFLINWSAKIHLNVSILWYEYMNAYMYVRNSIVNSQ